MPLSRIDGASSSSSLAGKHGADCVDWASGTRSGRGADSLTLRHLRVVATSPISAASPRPSLDFLLARSRHAHSVGLASSRSLGRSQRPLALDDFRCESQVGLAADAFEIVQQHRLAVGRRLRDAHVARDHGLIDLVAHEATHVGNDLAGELLRASYIVSTTPWMVSRD